MNEDLTWTRQLLDMLNENGVWVIPRSGAVIRLVSRTNRVVAITNGSEEEYLQDLLRILGWRIIQAS